MLFTPLDGVAPRAKMNQQRSRRFRSAQEAKEADEKKAEFTKLLRKQNKGKALTMEEEVIEKTWDSNVITPGTPFMDILALSLRYWVAYKLNTDPAWERVSVRNGPSSWLRDQLTLFSLKSSFQMQLYQVRVNTRSWNSSDHRDHAPNMTQIRAMSFTALYVAMFLDFKVQS